MAEHQQPDDNPFRMYSARNVLSRARERLQLIRHWLIRHEAIEPMDSKPKLNGKDRDQP